ncbi:Hypothetical protein D9617_11g009000 [Elsinoe fawcettii]|nr:Hypothetical protein D9617_11g009000 [Elsinoe fawcettii]
MPEIVKYPIPSSQLIPNSHLPLLHYKSFFPAASISPGAIFDLYESNGWTVNWIFRYGITQAAHYHSRAHECMTVLSGTATIRFGAADISDDLEASTWGEAGTDYEKGGVLVKAQKGDVFIIPAGVAHKTFDTSPKAEFKLLTPGRGKGIEAEDKRGALEKIEMDGFTMMGTYPVGSTEWDFVEREPDRREWERVWQVERPGRDPVLGKERTGICGTWEEGRRANL